MRKKGVYTQNHIPYFWDIHSIEHYEVVFLKKVGLIEQSMLLCIVLWLNQKLQNKVYWMEPFPELDTLQVCTLSDKSQEFLK